MSPVTGLLRPSWVRFSDDSRSWEFNLRHLGVQRLQVQLAATQETIDVTSWGSPEKQVVMGPVSRTATITVRLMDDVLFSMQNQIQELMDGGAWRITLGHAPRAWDLDGYPTGISFDSVGALRETEVTLDWAINTDISERMLAAMAQSLQPIKAKRFVRPSADMEEAEVARAKAQPVRRKVIRRDPD